MQKPALVRASGGVIHVLVRLYPREFRDTFGAAIERTFGDAADAAWTRSGAAGLVVCLVLAAIDVIRGAVREHAAVSSSVPAVGRRPLRRWGLAMETILHDIRYAFRSLTRAPVFSAVTVLTLGVGIGAVVSIFGVADGVLIRPLPFPEPDRIVRIYGSSTEDPAARGNVSPVDVVDWRERSRSFEAIATTSGTFLALTGTGEPEMVWVNATSANMFDVLRVRPAMGRLFTADEEVVGRHQVVVMSNSLWQSRFGGDPGILGRTIQLQGATYEIIGVLPTGFEDPSPGPFGDAVLWRPLALELTPGMRGGHWLQSYARLTSGSTQATARSELRDIMSQLETEYPVTNTNQTVELVTLHESLAGSLRRPLAVLLGAVAFLLLIACANVANLMLARTQTRHRELAVRAALGAGRLRVARQLAIESLVLAITAAAIGIGIAALTLRVTPALVGGLPRSDAIGINVPVMLFAIGLAALTPLLFGLAPFLEALRGDPQSALREGGRGSTTGVAGRRLRSLLIVGEVAMSVVLLAGAGLLVRSFQHLLAVDTGFDRSVLTATVSLPTVRYPADQRTAFFRDFEERARALPNVREAGVIDMLPLSGRWSCDSFAVGDREPPPEGREPCAETRTVSAGYFRAMGITIERGRAFDQTDREDAVPVAIIDDQLAREFWPDQDPVGKRVKWGWFGADTPWLTIVGVVNDVKHFGLDADGRPTIYMPLGQQASSRMTLVLSGGDVAARAAGVRRIVRDLDAELPLTRLETMSQVVSRSVAEPRFRTILLGAFAVVALLLSLAGLYGVLAFTVEQRTHEFGIRMAVGAARSDVLGMVVRQGLRLVIGGIMIGVPAASLATRALSGLLFDVPSNDATTFAAVTLLLVIVSTVASWLPALRATRVDPLVALRDE